MNGFLAVIRLLLLVALACGCSRRLDLENRRCGCGPGYRCCISSNRCVAASDACPGNAEGGAVDAAAWDTMARDAPDAAAGKEASFEAPVETAAEARPPCPKDTIECHDTCQAVGGICLVDILDVPTVPPCSLEQFRLCSALPDRPDCTAILRKVRVASNDLDQIDTACAAHFPVLKAQVCSLGPYQGMRVGLTMHVYDADGAFADSRTARVEYCP
jgi:hypothetical protein